MVVIIKPIDVNWDEVTLKQLTSAMQRYRDTLTSSTQRSRMLPRAMRISTGSFVLKHGKTKIVLDTAVIN